MNQDEPQPATPAGQEGAFGERLQARSEPATPPDQSTVESDQASKGEKRGRDADRAEKESTGAPDS
jgi:hypothetical protein